LVEAKTFSEDKAPSTYTRNILSMLYKKYKNPKSENEYKNMHCSPPQKSLSFTLPNVM
jgi:hypothetical protein